MKYARIYQKSLTQIYCDEKKKKKKKREVFVSYSFLWVSNDDDI
jgi:hypothetical protein